MRQLPLVPLCFVLAARLEGQARIVRPAPSLLFSAAQAELPRDTVRIDTGIPQAQGAFIGLVGGAAAGYFLTRLAEGGGDCTNADAGGSGACGPDTNPTKGRVVGAVLGGVAGMLLGSKLAGPRAVGRVESPLMGVAQDGGDSLVLIHERRKGGRTGALLGGTVGATLSVVAFGLSGSEPCADACGRENSPGRIIGVGFVGAAAGAGVGYLLGRSIPAHRPDPRPQLEPQLPPTRDTGMKWWQGALTGAGVGALSAAFLNYGLHGGERLELSDGEAALVFVPIGALLGAFVGGSVAQGR